MRLSKNFSLHEFLRSQVAERMDIDMTPTEEDIENIQHLVDTCMQPLRTELNAVIFISSGYRPYRLNTAIGGSKTSAHLSGSAVDFVVQGHSPLFVCRRIRDLQLPYDQNIHEFGKWAHLGVAHRARQDDLTAYRRSGQTKYVYGITPMQDLVA